MPRSIYDEYLKVTYYGNLCVNKPTCGISEYVFGGSNYGTMPSDDFASIKTLMVVVVLIIVQRNNWLDWLVFICVMCSWTYNIYMYVCMYVCMYIYIYIYIYLYIYIGRFGSIYKGRFTHPDDGFIMCAVQTIESKYGSSPIYIFIIIDQLFTNDY